MHKVSDRTFLMHLGGTIEMASKHPIRNRDDLSMVYTPGVARVCQAIAANPEDARRLTIKRNSVAVVTDGSAVLGLGNIGPAAALPVMEGKAALFKRFAGIDAWPLCLDTQDPDEIVEIVRAIAPGFAGINLEDISAPRCFEIEARLREILDIPVFHDDQHGTAIVVLAALTNALRVVGKELADVRVVMSGRRRRRYGDPAAAAGGGRHATSSSPTSTAWSTATGPGCTSRCAGSPSATNQRGLTGTCRRRSPAPTSSSASPRPTCSTATTSPRWPRTRSSSRWPTRSPRSTRRAPASTPPWWPPAARDYPNQINNVLAFPGRLPRAAGRVGRHRSTTRCCSPPPRRSRARSRDDELNANYIIPSVFHADVHTAVADAVRTAAEPSSVAPRAPHGAMPDHTGRAPARR